MGARREYVTVDTCGMCQPLGAVLALKGMSGTMPVIHGSQGCATYMRLYLARHFKEPVDIASSSLNEKDAIHGGETNLSTAIDNVIARYGPGSIGIIGSCLSETIGDDIVRFVADCRRRHPGVAMATIQNPNLSGDWSDGYRAAVRAVVCQSAERTARSHTVNVLPGMISPADTRYLKALVADSLLSAVVLPDNSRTLEAPLDLSFAPITEGGTPSEAIRGTAGADVSIELGLLGDTTAGSYLREAFGVEHRMLGLPVGLRATDALMATIGEVGGRIPERYLEPRGRLLDMMADAHRVLYGVKAAIYGEPGLVAALANFAFELGMRPVVLAGSATALHDAAETMAERYDWPYRPDIFAQADFEGLKEKSMNEVDFDILIGDSNGRHLAAEEDIPLVRVGFPINDRFGAARVTVLGYEAAVRLTDEIANSLLGKREITAAASSHKGVC